jgi:NADPH2:quinone reductase
MRAWQVRRHGEPRVALALADVVAPDPGPGLLRVRVAAAALGLPDLFMCRGSYALTPPLPFTPGQELAGVVTAAGEGAQARVGERVMAVSGFFLGRGAFAEEALALDDFAFPVPDEMSDAEAAAFPIAFHTAWVGLVRRAALRAGETLLVLGGAGGTGSAAIQLGRALGARVLATARGTEKAAFCLALGAQRAIDPTREDLAAAVRAETAGRGADVIYDPVGGDLFTAATQAIAHEGRLLAVGFASGRWGQVSLAHAATHNYSVVGVIPSGYDRAFRLDAQRALIEHVREGRLRVPVQRIFPFDALPEALAALEAGDVCGKLVLDGLR